MEINSSYLSAVMPFDPKRENVWKEIANYLKRYIRQDYNILELGAGYCHFINNIQAKTKYAVEINSEVIRKYADNDINILACDVLDFDKYTNECFHVIFVSNLFEHLSIEQLHQLIPKLRERLFDGGYLILLQPNYRYAYREYFDDYEHITIFDHISLRRLLNIHGFNITKVYKKFLPYSMDSKLPSFRWIVWLYLRLPFKIMGKQMLIVANKKN